jgi:DNA (cytosine-5)-methyltransferase 1
MAAYYNENDPFAAAWLRELIKAGLIAEGEVDERSIELVRPDDLRGYRQCHFFAGIGGWSYALRLAGWPDDRHVWTGSCPCQPFSSAGARDGGNDSRHLWPAWFRLIRECRPVVCFGEQVESAIAHGWIDAVFDDLEGADYAAAAVGLPAASIGAFHGRPRLWFVAHDNATGCHGLSSTRLHDYGSQRNDTERCGLYGALDLSECRGAERIAGGEGRAERETSRGGQDERRGQLQVVDASLIDWIACEDGRARPIEPGLEPLADDVPARVGRLRGYGNAIVPQVAQVFIESYLDLEREVNP